MQTKPTYIILTTTDGERIAIEKSTIKQVLESKDLPGTILITEKNIVPVTERFAAVMCQL